MAKRFTDTDKYKKPFLRSLPGAYKLLWDYVCSDCDHAGIWIVDFEIAQIYLGKDMPVDREDALRHFNARKVRVVEVASGSRWFIVPFIEFQYGSLNPQNRVHCSVINCLTSFGLWDGRQNQIKLHVSPLRGAMDKDKERDEEEESDKEREEQGARAEIDAMAGAGTEPGAGAGIGSESKDGTKLGFGVECGEMAQRWSGMGTGSEGLPEAGAGTRSGGEVVTRFGTETRSMNARGTLTGIGTRAQRWAVAQAESGTGVGSLAGGWAEIGAMTEAGTEPRAGIESVRRAGIEGLPEAVAEMRIEGRTESGIGGMMRAERWAVAQAERGSETEAVTGFGTETGSVNAIETVTGIGTRIEMGDGTQAATGRGAETRIGMLAGTKLGSGSGTWTPTLIGSETEARIGMGIEGFSRTWAGNGNGIGSGVSVGTPTGIEMGDGIGVETGTRAGIVTAVVTGTRAESETVTGAGAIEFAEAESASTDFDSVWILYGRKGNKKTSVARWNKLPLKTKTLALDHIPKYVRSTPNITYRKNFETYINQQAWNDEIIISYDKHENSKGGPSGITSLSGNERKFGSTALAKQSIVARAAELDRRRADKTF